MGSSPSSRAATTGAAGRNLEAGTEEAAPWNTSKWLTAVLLGLLTAKLPRQLSPKALYFQVSCNLHTMLFVGPLRWYGYSSRTSTVEPMASTYRFLAVSLLSLHTWHPVTAVCNSSSRGADTLTQTFMKAKHQYT